MTLQKLSNNDLFLAPSLLAADFANLEAELKSTEEAGVQILHLDVMDGHFVPNLSIGPPVIEALRPKTKMLFDVHLMLTHPKDYLENFKGAGADHITFHLESDSPVQETLDQIKSLGLSTGLSVKPGTPVEELFPYLDSLDMVLIMTVEPGFGGQKFMSSMLEKVKVLRAEIEHRGLATHIQVDGGVGEANAASLRQAGANIFVAGTAFFRHPHGKASASQAILSAE